MALSQTIIGKQTLDDGRILEYGAKDPTTGQRFERIISAQEATQKPTLESVESGVKQAQETLSGIQQRVATEGITLKPIEPEVSAKDISLGTTETEIPTPKVGASTTAFNQGLLESLETTKKAYEDALKVQMDNLAKQKQDYETKITNLETKQEKTLTEDIKPLMEPFREKLETTERERLKVEENYFANQKSVGELESLLTTGQAEISTIESTPGLAAIKSSQVARKKEDIAARAGVLQAVMSARNGQINVAYSLIDRTAQAITNDRKDQLSYYETVFNFYETEKDTLGGKLITLDKEEKNYIQQQITNLKAESELSQQSVQMIKEAMLNPKTATVYEQSGIKLTDNPAGIQKKLSDYSYQQEVIELNNKMETNGYDFLITPEQIALKEADPNVEMIRQKDSKGKEYVYWKEKKTETGTGDDWAKGRQFIMDNPNASYTELYQALDDNTNLPDDEIKKLLEDKEKIAKESKTLSKSQILTAAQAMKQDDVENYLRSRFGEDELKNLAKESGFTGGGFLGIGVGTKGIKDYIASPAARNKVAEFLGQEYAKSGYTITE